MTFRIVKWVSRLYYAFALVQEVGNNRVQSVVTCVDYMFVDHDMLAGRTEH